MERPGPGIFTRIGTLRRSPSATKVSYRDRDFSTGSMTASSPGTSEPISATRNSLPTVAPRHNGNPGLRTRGWCLRAGELPAADCHEMAAART